MIPTFQLGGMGRGGGALPSIRAQVLAALAGQTFGLYDISDISTLFQDAAMTTPVTAVGQAVGAVKDVSANGLHLTQATATARPLYQFDGTLPYLSFDGADDVLLSTSTLPLALPFYLACAVDRIVTATESTDYVMALELDSTNHMTIGGRTASLGWQLLRNTARGQVIAQAAGYTVGSKHVVSGLSVAGTTDAQVDAVNTGSIANTWAGDSTAGARIKMGGGAGGIRACRVYGGIGLAANPGANRTLIERWLGSLNGVPL